MIDTLLIILVLVAVVGLLYLAKAIWFDRESRRIMGWDEANHYEVRMARNAWRVACICANIAFALLTVLYTLK